MTRYEIKIAVKELGTVKHVTKAKTAEEAQQRVQKAHPKGAIVSCQTVMGAKA